MAKRITADQAKDQADAFGLTKEDILNTCYDTANAVSIHGRYQATTSFLKRVTTASEVQAATDQLEQDGYKVTVTETGSDRMIHMDWSDVGDNPGKGKGKGHK